ncbi:MAG: hypothetical protein CMM93_03485 [Rickettsiales bacterium]|nr:hypothetical protein [Rickettsiales bacterium]
MHVHVYGIKNCDTVKKALAWLDEHNINYEFHDYKQYVPEDRVHAFIEFFGADRVLNKQGQTWRKLSEREQAGISDDSSVFRFLIEKPSAIKRPIVTDDLGQPMLLGFKPEEWTQRLL